MVDVPTLECECGEKIESAGAKIAAERGLSFKVVCLCERRYVLRDGAWHPDGTQRNPFAGRDWF